MGTWIAVGDETGGWDMVNGRFDTEFTGVAWVLGSVEAWESAMRQPRGALTAMDAFSQPIHTRLPAGVALAQNSDKYHLLDIWKSVGKTRADVYLDVPQVDPALEILRSDAEWLLCDSGLGVLAVGGNRADAKAAGLWFSGDGLRERARAFSALMAVALPFLPGSDDLHLTVEGRTESRTADAVQHMVGASSATDRCAEPYRDFLGRLGEDMRRLSTRCQDLVVSGKVTESISTEDGREIANLLRRLRQAPTLQHRSGDVVKAMKGIADLATALAPRSDTWGCRLIVPDACARNLWTGNYRELRDVIPV